MSSRSVVLGDSAVKSKRVKAKPTRKKTAAKKPTSKRVSKKSTTKKVVTKNTLKTKPQKSDLQTVKVKDNTNQTQPLTQTEITTYFKREPLGHLLCEQMLKDAGFTGSVSSDAKTLDAYSTDESIFSVRPQIVIHPMNQRDIEVAVKTLGRETKRFSSLSLTPRAAGTGLSGGSLTDSIVIDVLRHMHHVGEVVTKKDVSTITVSPGTMWRDIEKKLKTHNLYLPCFPASKDLCTIGGAVGNNAAGPDSLRYGHVADWVESLDVTLHDGVTYTFAPLTYKELKTVMKQKNAHGKIASEVFDLISANEAAITKAKPKTKKNSAGYALWNVLDVSVAQFKKGKGTFDLTRIVSGSQGTIGIITSITMRATPINEDTSLIVIPVFDLADASSVVLEALKYDPINVEVFDGLTFDLALQNPSFFKDRITGTDYYKVLLSMYTTYHVRYGQKTPEFTLLVTVDNLESDPQEALRAIKAASGTKARLIKSPTLREMFWQIRRASYSLSKLEDPTKRPAAFLEDMTVPPKNLAPFFKEIKQLLKKYNVTAAVHGHGGNGHFHFYPLLDFTSKSTPAIVEKMSEEFFSAAMKYDGNICGEHNDGIIRTPHLNKMFNKKTLDLFRQVEHLFDPDDIFNPGKKVNPKFDIKNSLRHTN